MKKNILIIEDNEDLSSFYTSLLEEHDWNVCVAQGIVEARKKLLFSSFNVVLLDLMLNGESGRSILCEIKKIYTMPVIILTNMSFEEDNALKAGADLFMIKSEVDPVEIIEAVERLGAC